jgi:transcriptional regulator with XRE-family HTH domain
MLKTPEQISQIIARARAEKNISLEKAAAVCDLTSLTFTRVERALVTPRVGTLKSIARGLNIPFTQFTTSFEEEKLSKEPDTAIFIGQEQLSSDDRKWYYRQLLSAIEVKCLAFHGDGLLKGGGTILKDKKNATLDCFIEDQQWFLHSTYNNGDTVCLKLYNRRREAILVHHLHPLAIDVMQQLLAARWRPDPLAEDED